MKQRYGLSCWLQKASDVDAYIQIHWRSTAGEQLTIDKNTVQLTNAIIRPIPDVIKTGDNYFTFQREPENRRKVAMLTLNGTTGNNNHGCVVVMAPEIGHRVDIIETNSKLLHLEDVNCYQLGKGPCDFWVTWEAPEPGMQAIIRAGENNQGYFACGSSPEGKNRKLAPWGPEKLTYFQVPATGPKHGCTDVLPQGSPVAESVIKFR